MDGWLERQRRKQFDRVNDRPPHRLWATRKARRRLVVVEVAALCLLWAGLVIIGRYAPSDLARNVYLLMFGVSLLVGIPVAGWLTAATRGSTTLGEHHLDERQLHERRGAYATAHKLTTVLLGALYVLTVFWSYKDGQLVVTIPLALTAPLGLTLLATHYMLPLLVAGWRLPDPPPDDEE